MDKLHESCARCAYYPGNMGCDGEWRPDVATPPCFSGYRSPAPCPGCGGDGCGPDGDACEDCDGVGERSIVLSNAADDLCQFDPDDAVYCVTGPDVDVAGGLNGVVDGERARTITAAGTPAVDARHAMSMRRPGWDAWASWDRGETWFVLSGDDPWTPPFYLGIPKGV